MKHAFIGILVGWAMLSSLTAAERRPLLYPNPENPSAHPFQDFRALMLERFDADQDGYLNPQEREQLRLTTKRDANQRSEKVREARRQRREREGETNRPPDRWLKLYDKNKNNRFDGGEWEFARSTEVKRVTELFDSNKDGELNEEEIKTLIADLKTTQYNGYDQYIRRRVAGIDERGRTTSRRRGQSRWKAFDFNQDGKASPEELLAIRQHEAQARKESKDDR